MKIERDAEVGIGGPGFRAGKEEEVELRPKSGSSSGGTEGSARAGNSWQRRILLVWRLVKAKLVDMWAVRQQSLGLGSLRLISDHL